jgi:hypothetical protein
LLSRRTTTTALWAGGWFTAAGGVAANRIARWDGASWTALGSGMDDGVFALLVFDHGTGPALFAGGDFEETFDSADAFVAEWGLDTDPPSIDCPGVVNALEALGSPPGEVVSFTVTASDEVDPAPTVVCVPASGSFFPRGTTLVTCTATDACGNQSTCQFPVTVQIKARRQ